jgi:hypothetical protein
VRVQAGRLPFKGGICSTTECEPARADIQFGSGVWAWHVPQHHGDRARHRQCPEDTKPSAPSQDLVCGRETGYIHSAARHWPHHEGCCAARSEGLHAARQRGGLYYECWMTTRAACIQDPSPWRSTLYRHLNLHYSCSPAPSVELVGLPDEVHQLRKLRHMAAIVRGALRRAPRQNRPVATLPRVCVQNTWCRTFGMADLGQSDSETARIQAFIRWPLTLHSLQLPSIPPLKAGKESNVSMIQSV